MAWFQGNFTGNHGFSSLKGSSEFSLQSILGKMEQWFPTIWVPARCPFTAIRKLLKKYHQLKEKGAFNVSIKIKRTLEKRHKLAALKKDKKDKKDKK